MATVFLTKTLSGFVPADQASAEICRKFKAGSQYRAEIVKPRNYQHHKLAMALLNLTYSNLPEQMERAYPTFDAFRYAVAEAAGHKEQYPTLDGEVRVRAKSISYDAIPDDVEFGQVMAAMFTVCAGILQVSAPELEQEVARYADSKYGR